MLCCVFHVYQEKSHKFWNVFHTFETLFSFIPSRETETRGRLNFESRLLTGNNFCIEFDHIKIWKRNKSTTNTEVSLNLKFSPEKQLLNHSEDLPGK